MSSVLLYRILKNTSLALVAATLLSACGALGGEENSPMRPEAVAQDSIPAAAQSGNSTLSPPATAGFTTQETVLRKPGFPEFTVDPAGTVGRYQIGPSYSLNGQVVTPIEDFTYKETGLAGWYGDGFEGATTANGERLKSNLRTLAHRTLPFGTIVRVTSLDNGRSVVARVNDRGPIQTQRLIDVTTRIRDELGFNNADQARVQVQVLAQETQLVAQLTGGTTGVGAALGSGANSNSQPAGTQSMTIERASLSPELSSAASSSLQSPVPPALQEPKPIPTTNSNLARPVNQSASGSIPRGVYIQAGSFRDKNNALSSQANLSQIGQVKIHSVNVDGRPLWQTLVGPYASESDARVALGRVVASGVTDAFIRRF